MIKKTYSLSSEERKVIFISSLGGALEFYDFMIFIYLANTIGSLFFPTANHINTLLAVFSVFFVGYMARPLGGILFGHFGDKLSRKSTFYFTIILMALPSLLISILPTYRIGGIFATILLVLLRIVQGLAIGGEIPGAITFTIESVLKDKRGLACALIFFGFSSATLLAQFIVGLFQYAFTQRQFDLYGWRIPFLIGSILGVIGIYLRRKLNETPVFKEYKISYQKIKVPIYHVLHQHYKEILSGMFIICFGAISMFLLFIYMPLYLTDYQITLHSNYAINSLNTYNLLYFALLIPISGRLSDIYGRSKLIMISAFGILISSILIFNILISGTYDEIMLAMLLASTFFAFAAGSYGALLPELFPTSVRYTGVAICYNISFAFFGGTTPLIATYLIKITNYPLIPAYYLMFAASVGMLGSFMSYKIIKKKHNSV